MIAGATFKWRSNVGESGLKEYAKGMFWMDKTKTQSDELPVPEGLPADTIVSADVSTGCHLGSRGRRNGRFSMRAVRQPLIWIAGPLVSQDWWKHPSRGIGKSSRLCRASKCSPISTALLDGQGWGTCGKDHRPGS